MNSNNVPNPIIFQNKPWSNNSNPIWLVSTIGLHRNVEKFKFPGKLGTDRKQQIISLVGKELLSKDVSSADGLVNPVLIKAEDIGALEKEFLVEHFLSIQNYNQAHAGEGFVLDETGEFLATLNMGDHIHLQFIDCKGELEHTWNRLLKMETTLEKSINYSFLPKFGFLTADPTQCGTALVVTVYLQLTGLIHTGKVDDVLDKLADDSLYITGIQGNPNEIIGDVLMVRNNYTLGVSEENIISSMRNFTTKVLAEEISARNQIKREDSADFKDRVSRSYGILVHSYQIEAIEALNALSLLKLGCEAGWVSGIDNRELNELFFNCRRAHILHQCGEKLSQPEIPHKRSELIHQALKNVKLLV
ncbi:MAG: protein arginine kinase [Parachlamydiaceae bacterium]